MKAIICTLILAVATTVFGQQSKVTAWRPIDGTSRGQVYHPEPILFVHGINSNDADWTNSTITSLISGFLQYDLPDSAIPLTGVLTNLGYNVAQTNYLHTFNYGDQPGQPHTHDQQAFDYLQWNAWSPDRDSLPYTNYLVSPPQVRFASDDRVTLDERINGRAGGLSGIRQAYATDPADTNTWPHIILVAHSMGGLLSHYYLLKQPTDNGVRRLVTLATPHQGSHYANWMVSYLMDPLASFQNMNAIQKWTLVGGANYPSTAGFFINGTRGAVGNLVVVGQSQGVSGLQGFQNPLMNYFWNNPAPHIEYVFNWYRRPAVTRYVVFQILTSNAAPSEAVDGDGFVAPWSAAGKAGGNVPSIWNGISNTNGIHNIDPVIFGPWTNLDHSAAESDSNSLYRSILGVPYRWQGASSNQWPAYASTYGENQSLSKYFTAPSSNSTAYTDEPGIADLKLLYNRASGNSLLLPTLNTWTVTNGALQKVFTNNTNFAGHQIVSGSGGTVTYLGTVGVKNLSQNPVGTSGSNYWVAAGNEYLPASESVQVSNGIAPIVVATNIASLSGVRMITNCLVQLDTNSAPQYEYGYFENSSGITTTASTNNFVAVQGYNLAQLITPQTERAFNSPVDSATLVAILQKINQGEALSNGCHNAGAITRWIATINEWVVSSNSSFALNFFPTSSSPNVLDAWTGTAYDSGNWSYSATTKTFTLNNSSNAPTQIIVSNEVYLGCDQVFTNSYGGIVPALTNNALAGVQVTGDFVGQVRTALEAILGKYKNTVTNVNYVAWTKPIILAAITNNTGDWTPITNGLLKAQHFTELKAVADLLTTSVLCTCQLSVASVPGCFDGGGGTNGAALTAESGWCVGCLYGAGAGHWTNECMDVLYGCSGWVATRKSDGSSWTDMYTCVPPVLVFGVETVQVQSVGGVFTGYDAEVRCDYWNPSDGAPAVQVFTDVYGDTFSCGNSPCDLCGSLQAKSITWNYYEAATQVEVRAGICGGCINSGNTYHVCPDIIHTGTGSWSYSGTGNSASVTSCCGNDGCTEIFWIGGGTLSVSVHRRGE